MIRRYRVNKHCANTGCAAFDGRDSRPIASRPRLRSILGGRREAFEWCLLVYLAMAPKFAEW